METVFDFNLTDEELDELGFLSPLLFIRHGIDFPDPLTPEGYRQTITDEAANFDLYLLFDFRNQPEQAAVYAARVPEKVAEYQLGFDYDVRASEEDNS